MISCYTVDMLRVIRYYKGWDIFDNGVGFHPVTGRFMAYRYGVRMGASTRAALISMIDMR